MTTQFMNFADPNQVTEIFLSCPQGQVMTGGACFVQDPSSLNVSPNFSSDLSGMNCHWVSNGINNQVAIQIICARLVP